MAAFHHAPDVCDGGPVRCDEMSHPVPYRRNRSPWFDSSGGSGIRPLEAMRSASPPRRSRHFGLGTRRRWSGPPSPQCG